MTSEASAGEFEIRGTRIENGPAQAGSATAPAAKRVPFERVHHGDTVVDPYAWLAKKDDPETVAYLTAENAYTEARTAHQAPLREAVFTEIKNRTQETDVMLPQRKGSFWYYARTVEGQQYGIHCRKAVAEGETAPPISLDRSPLPDEIGRASCRERVSECV